MPLLLPLQVWNVNRVNGLVFVANVQGASWDRVRRCFVTHDAAPPPLQVSTSECMAPLADVVTNTGVLNSCAETDLQDACWVHVVNASECPASWSIRALLCRRYPSVRMMWRHSRQPGYSRKSAGPTPAAMQFTATARSASWRWAATSGSRQAAVRMPKWCKLMHGIVWDCYLLEASSGLDLRTVRLAVQVQLGAAEWDLLVVAPLLHIGRIE